MLSHVRLGRRAEDVASPKIVPGGADLMIAADDVVAASGEARGLCDPERTFAVVNTALTPVADFVRNRDFDFKAHAVVASLRKAVREGSDFVDFRAAAETVAGDAIASNIMMLGHAWQSGRVPLSLEAIMTAIELNGVAVKANVAAFNWGRLLAAEPHRLDALVEKESAGETPLAEMTTDEIIAHREAHLTAYQSARLARRYRALVDKVRAAEAEKGLDGALTRAAAISYAKLLAYKDEYEVARQLSDPAFLQGLKDRFDGETVISYHLAPPMLSGEDANGRPKKRRFGPWLRAPLGLLKHGKILRGTWLDPFGRTEERRMERRLIADYEAMIEATLPKLDRERAAAARALYALPESIRGFGPVKKASVEAAEAERARLLEAFERPGAPRPGASDRDEDGARIAAE